jgi:hypothetical protein
MAIMVSCRLTFSPVASAVIAASAFCCISLTSPSDFWRTSANPPDLSDAPDLPALSGPARPAMPGKLVMSLICIAYALPIDSAASSTRLVAFTAATFAS